jgi:hypothetical protein
LFPQQIIEELLSVAHVQAISAKVGVSIAPSIAFGASGAIEIMALMAISDRLPSSKTADMLVAMV